MRTNDPIVKIGKSTVYVLLSIAAFIWLFPLIWLALGSFKTQTGLGAPDSVMTLFPVSQLDSEGHANKGLSVDTLIHNYEEVAAPAKSATTTQPAATQPVAAAQAVPVKVTPFYTTDNYHQLFHDMDYPRLMMNSAFVTGCTVVLQLFFASLGGFALAKYQFKGKRIIMLIMLATMMLPFQVLLAPLYELIHTLGLLDRQMGLIVPGMVSVFGMFLFRQAMMQIPDELLQAGRIDGCSELGIFWHVALPVSRPMIGAFCLSAFMATWNSFLWPQIILKNTDRFTLPLGLATEVSVYQQNYGALMAGTLLSFLPVVIIFFLLQREFITGLTQGAVKG